MAVGNDYRPYGYMMQVSANNNFKKLRYNLPG
jgi:hypothetical protein